MLRVVCILKEKSGKTIGAKVTDGIKTKNVTVEDLIDYKIRGILFDNAVITSDGYVRGKDCHLPSKTYGIDIIAPLYHGSIGGIRGSISLDYGDDAMDFGRSFYLGTHKMQAIARAAKESNGYLYTFDLDTSDLKFFNFKDEVLWALYIARNRGLIEEISEYKSLIKFFVENIDCCDVIYGYIADDKMASTYRGFVSGSITDKGLVEALKSVRFGKQYALRTYKAIGNLSLLRKERIVQDVKNRSLKWENSERFLMISRLKDIKRSYVRKGAFIYDVLDKYERLAEKNKL